VPVYLHFKFLPVEECRFQTHTRIYFCIRCQLSSSTHCCLWHMYYVYRYFHCRKCQGCYEIISILYHIIAETMYTIEHQVLSIYNDVVCTLISKACCDTNKGQRITLVKITSVENGSGFFFFNPIMKLVEI